MLPFIACFIGLVLSIRVSAEPLVEGRVHLASGCQPPECRCGCSI